MSISIQLVDLDKLHLYVSNNRQTD